LLLRDRDGGQEGGFGGGGVVWVLLEEDFATDAIQLGVVAGQEFWPPFADCQLETERQIPVVLDPIHQPSGPERAPQFMDFTPMFLGDLRAFP
jgi:hypothetical protein